MNRFIYTLFATISFVACTQSSFDELSAIRSEHIEPLIVGFEEAEDTRIELNDVLQTVWTAGDMVSVFYRSDANQKWLFNGETGARIAELHCVEEGVKSQTNSRVVVVYPYNAEYIYSNNTGDIELSLPATQHYLRGSYGLGDNLMVSQSEFTQFSLKNVCGWLRIELTGKGQRVESISLKGNNGEQVAGKIYVDTATAESTYSSDVNNSSDTVVKTLSIDCGDGVSLSSEVTSFYFSLPPQRFTKGITVEIKCEGYKPMTLSTANEVNITRNHILPMQSVEYSSDIATDNLPLISSIPASLSEYMTEDVIVILNAKGTAIEGYRGDLYAHTGVITNLSTQSSDWKYVKAEWTTNISDCKLTHTGNDIWTLTIKGGPRAYYGVHNNQSIHKLAFVFRSADCKMEVKNNGKDIFLDVASSTPSTILPAGVKDGVNVDGNSATFVLYAPGKSSVTLLGDFNNYRATDSYKMKRDGDYFWITVDNLEMGKEYGYQYLVDGSIRVADPYSTKILDPWNDKWISSSVYPNLKAYPSNYTSDIVSVFELNPKEYQWTITDFNRPAERSLAIYELLLRDFTSESSVDAAYAKLDYLDELGINAIELMPIQEFDGNDSWGYNPCFYFAPDKAYGTEEAYKRFIDECHKRGIAVILDIVINHATGQFPWAKMWWDSANNRTNSSNPFFNEYATHNWSVYHDFNHLYGKTQEYFKEVLQFWLKEYKVDGFRFDLSKGIVQNPGDYDASGYSSERIWILTQYANAIREVEPDAYIILEHFCDSWEEGELYSTFGGLCWNNNQMKGYSESVMGWFGENNQSSFADFKQGRVNNIESHDEERLAFKAVSYGQDWVKNDWSVISKRLQIVYAFHFLTPYPKMMWQFGELGYDISVEEGGRTSRKPVHWEYANNAQRKAIYNTISKVLKFRTERSDIYGRADLPIHRWDVGDNVMGGKTLVMDNVIMIANLNSFQCTTTVNVPYQGKWRNLMTGQELSLGSTYSATLNANDYVILVR